MKTNKIKLTLISIAIIFFITSCCTDKKAKYVFYFIGDGMGFSHIALTEAYNATVEGKIGSTPLRFTQFPVMGMATSYSASNYITCSSAAGTALATGSKTKNAMLGKNADSLDLTAISYKIHNAGYPVGIMSSVQLDHATPAAFYGHSAKRSDYYGIATELAPTNFEFFGGGGFIGADDKRNEEKPIIDMVKEGGYEVAYGLEEFKAKRATAKKMVLLQREEVANKDLPYALDRKEGDLSLPQVVEAAVDFLDNQKGFFIMAEGGKIDWAAHANDVAGTIFETIDMDQAIEVAYQFYLKHPNETLIVVTADHETGGVTLGYKKGYVYDLKVIQKSIEERKEVADTDAANYMDVVPSDSLSKAARIGWTTTSHTGGAVPVFAIGANSELFAGRQDNTDIPKKICKAMGIEF